MPSPGRRNTPPPPGSSSYRRHRSPDRRHKMEPPSRAAGSSRNASPPSNQRSRRPPPVHTSRPPPDSQSRPSAGKRKASPKRERDIVRGHPAAERNRPTPRKMMRSASPPGPPSRDIPLLAPGRVASPPSRGYPHPSAPSRHYAPDDEPAPPQRGYSAAGVKTTSRSYSDLGTVTLVSDSRSYSMSTSVKPPSSSRPYAGSSAALVRRSPSEERPVHRSSASNRATAHMTSNRFSDMRGDDEELLARRSDSLSHKTGLTDYKFNVSNEPKAKFTRDGLGVVRTIINPESLQVVRRPAPPGREAPSYDRASNNNNNMSNNGCEWEDEDLDRSRPAWGNTREGARPIFDRDEIKQQALGRPDQDEGIRAHGLVERPPIKQVARYVPSDAYVDAPREPRNGQSRSADARPSASHSRDIPSHSREAPRSRDVPSSHARDAPPYSRSGHVREREPYHEPEGRREYRTRDYEEEESRARHDNGAHRSSRRDERDDLRHELELRRDPAQRHSPDQRGRGERPRDADRPRGDARGDARGESDSDLRVRINEKRSTRSTDRVFRERPDERSRPHDRERRRSPSTEHRRPSDPYERSKPSRGGEPGARSAPHDREGYRERSPHGGAAPPPRYHEERDEYHQALMPWVVDDPEHVPRGNAYFEHDNRGEGMVMVRGRGFMHVRGAPFMGRGMRRPYRGSPMNRGGYVMLSRGPRRGFGPPRRARPSSPQWEHDMFDKLAAEPIDQ